MPRNDVTLALRETGFKPSIAFLDGRIVDIGERFGIAGDYDFANIAVWSRKIFQRIPQRKISFIPVLLDWIKEGGKIGGVVLNEGKWLNIGSSAQYVEAHRMIASENWSPDFIRDADWAARIAKSATIDATAQLRGLTVVGADCYIGAGAVVQDTIVWPGAQIASLSELQELYCPHAAEGRGDSAKRHRMKTELLLRQTRRRLPAFGEGEIEIAPIEKGGSDRRFYRVSCAPGESLILVKYNLERAENRHYVRIAEFLTEHGIAVPKDLFS